jgi:hypothetical protein
LVAEANRDPLGEKGVRNLFPWHDYGWGSYYLSLVAAFGGAKQEKGS